MTVRTSELGWFSLLILYFFLTVVVNVFISTNAICLERPVPEVTCYV